MSARIDLHTHSDCSDGMLSPAALVARAATREVRLLALTDHDTLAGCAAARAACEQHGIEFVAGVELTCEWRGREIHVIGLQVNDADPSLMSHCEAVLVRRPGHVVRERLAHSRRGLHRRRMVVDDVEPILFVANHVAVGDVIHDFPPP